MNYTTNTDITKNNIDNTMYGPNDTLNQKQSTFKLHQ